MVAATEQLMVLESALKLEVTETSTTPELCTVVFINVTHEKRKVLNPCIMSFPIQQVNHMISVLMRTHIKRRSQFPVIVKEREQVDRERVVVVAIQLLFDSRDIVRGNGIVK